MLCRIKVMGSISNSLKWVKSISERGFLSTISSVKIFLTPRISCHQDDLPFNDVREVFLYLCNKQKCEIWGLRVVQVCWALWVKNKTLYDLHDWPLFRDSPKGENQTENIYTQIFSYFNILLEDFSEQLSQKKIIFKPLIHKA